MASKNKYTHGTATTVQQNRINHQYASGITSVLVAVEDYDCTLNAATK